MGCCGDTAAVTAKIIAARTLGVWEPGGFTLAKKNSSETNSEQENPYVQLEFVGPQVGSVTYNGLTGESYKAGNNSQDRIINALRADAEKLLNLRDEVGRPIFQLAAGAELPAGEAADVGTDPVPASGDILTDPAAAEATPNAGVVADIQAAEDTAVADAVANADSAKSKTKSK
jgi:hypothetical protein